MSVPLIIAGVVLWTLNILTAWSMISAGYPLVVVFTASLGLLFTIAVSRRRINRGAASLAESRDGVRGEQLKTTV